MTLFSPLTTRFALLGRGHSWQHIPPTYQSAVEAQDLTVEQLVELTQMEEDDEEKAAAVGESGDDRQEMVERDEEARMVTHVLDEEIVEVVDEIQTVVVVACLPAAVVAEQRPWLLSTPELADPSL
ncbi:hypothetical protein MUK42_04126 [Musa troglodytarum]|uniref:Uncharacterized protein n=1 Tax=Musa troglodytarum TaxID=320322 RepID=A0A9E7G703_9LILI|nr:hypothetical protein MUK42_04126 [Musa troglodytarum]